ncbi:CPK17 [Symbiodinium natans]|uniref:CPK17 protein n=1 Tax=Symbiodinium natans TaxID=878477 RepID=A0A812KJS4_9DINO|nr:CPK17 [Symbiodinium natans]
MFNERRMSVQRERLAETMSRSCRVNDGRPSLLGLAATAAPGGEFRYAKKLYRFRERGSHAVSTMVARRNDVVEKNSKAIHQFSFSDGSPRDKHNRDRRFSESASGKAPPVDSKALAAELESVSAEMRNLIAGVDLDHMGPGLSTTGKAEVRKDDDEEEGQSLHSKLLRYRYVRKIEAPPPALEPLDGSYLKAPREVDKMEMNLQGSRLGWKRDALARAQHWNNETKERILSARHRRDEEAVKHESNLLHQIAAKEERGPSRVEANRKAQVERLKLKSAAREERLEQVRQRRYEEQRLRQQELREQLENSRKRNKLESWPHAEQSAPGQEGAVEDASLQEEADAFAPEVEEPVEAKEETVDWFESFKEEDEEEEEKEEEKEKKRPKRSEERIAFKTKVEIYLALDHPHIARLMMVYEDDQEIHLVMEFMAGGELYDRLFDAKVYNEEVAANTCHQMLKAVSYMHAHQIAHRDLKLENFLYERKDNNHLKLIDFGFAKFWDRSTKMSQACGSTHYVAPEVLAKSYTLKADMWSLGVISYMLLTGSPPFQGGNDNEVLRKIRAGKIHWSSRFKRLSEGAQDFVKALLAMNPEERLDAAGALSHPWIVGNGGLRGTSTVLDDDIKLSLRKFARASTFRRAVLSMMAWSLSAEDRAQLRNEFLQFDTDNKGTITHLQMKEILEKNYHIDSMEAEAVFSMMDTDHDDVIAYSEFLAAALQGRLKVHEDILRRTFRKFDIDNCGRITADDLRNILGEQFEGTDAEDLIREADTNGDGMIEYDEFLQYFHNHESQQAHLEGCQAWNSSCQT